MKRLLKTKTIIEETLTIDIYPKYSNVVSSSILDTQSNEYENFIQSMIDMFAYAGFELYNDPEYTHKSNRGSESWYYTFIKVEDFVEIRVVVNVRISDHPDKDRGHTSAQAKRSNYTAKIASELSAEYESKQIPLSIPVDIVFDDEKYCKSYVAAQFFLRDQIQDIVDYYEEWKLNNANKQ